MSFRPALEISKANKYKPGYLVIVQGPTSDTATNINVLSPRLKNYAYQVIDSSGQALKVDKHNTLQEAGVFYKVDQLFISGLSIDQTYKLIVIDEFRGQKTQIDEREFTALNVKKSQALFATLSCMSDDYRFAEAIGPMWERLANENPDFIILNGDTVYVDSFEFVERKKATSRDLWQRYIDSFQKIPLFHWQKLKPVFATWDDHDYGTNDGDSTFIAKEYSRIVFRAFFGGKSLPEVWEPGPHGVSSRLHAFGQNFFLMDDRFFRHPDKDAHFGHWGKEQHQWLIQNLKASTVPSWIFNGSQFFNGKQLDFKEAFELNHPLHFTSFLSEIKSLPAPVVFSSGDIHFSEIMRVPKEILGYESYELTASSMHSYSGKGWENPLRVSGAFTNEFNFLLIQTHPQNNTLKLQVQALGRSRDPLFKTTLEVRK